MKFEREAKDKIEREKKDEGILCQLTNVRHPIDKIYILDECSHKFERGSLLDYITKSVMTQVNVKCPICPAAVSVRDMKELMPKK